MIAFIETVVGLAVILIAGFLVAEHRDRIRTMASATILGITAGEELSDAADTGIDDHRGHDASSHPAGPHWERLDSSDHTDSM